MVFGLFRGRKNSKLIGRLHREIIAAARDPVLFTDYRIPDTIDGRFESMVLHASLVLRRLNELPAPGPDIGQDLADAVFRHFDIALRDVGVSDTRVPKQMKAMAEAFFGRATAYHEALANGVPALAQALSRNIYDGADDGERLAHYVVRLDAALASATVARILSGSIPFARAASQSEEVAK